jgi:ATP-binding cassette ChvD family protein
MKMADAPPKIIYSMIRVGKKIGQKTILKDISLSYFYGAKIGVLGLNGSGKSTLLKIMAGVEQEFLGETTISPGFTVGYLEQEPALNPEKTVKETVAEGVAETVALLEEFEKISERFSEPMDDDEMNRLLDRQGQVQERLDVLDAWNLDSRLSMAMDALRCPPEDQKTGTLSGGEKRRVALCRLLLQEPDILLLDEPTNHLDAETVAWLEQHLQRYQGTVIAVTHDRYFLDNVAGWILELDRGEGIPWKGNYSSWLQQKQARLALEEKQAGERQRTLLRELEWVQMSPKGRQAKSKSRLHAYESLLSENIREREKELQIFIPPGPRLGTEVIKADGLSKRYGDKLLFEQLEFTLPAAAILGIIGPNGAGKTTLMRMIIGTEQADEGNIAIGQTVKLAYADQNRELLNDELTVWEQISEGNDLIYLGNREVNSRAYVSRFNFMGTDQQKKMKVLSGGERNRVNLALMLKSGANVLLLDEPTNDLDVNTLRALEEGLLQFAGNAVIISHDRWFLDRVATHILAFEGDSQVTFFCGNYSEYIDDKKKRLGVDSLIPTRIKYRHLTRD